MRLVTAYGTFLFLCFLALTPWRVYAIEPLRGPEVGQDWRRNPDADDEREPYGKSIERTLSADVPIPVAIGASMPFVTLRYRDHVRAHLEPTFVSDQKYGLGLLHHADEGDPAWRIEAIRVGSAASTPGLWGRVILNLGKAYPWLKLDHTDDLTAWIGINAVGDDRRKALWFPEFAWIRVARDGTVIDLAAPGRFFLGLRGSVFGILAGAEQQLIRWTDSHKNPAMTTWFLRRESVLKMEWYLRDEFKLTLRLARELNQTSAVAATSAGVFLMWVPNS
jgi:hypothetical protein